MLFRSAIRGMGSQVQVQNIDPLELKAAVAKLADLMEEAAHRFDRMLQKPILMIEKQMEQQRYLFEEADKQKDFLERLFGELLDRQRHELMSFLDHQARRLDENLDMQRRLRDEVSARLQNLEAEMAGKLGVIEKNVQNLVVLSQSIPQKKEGAA